MKFIGGLCPGLGIAARWVVSLDTSVMGRASDVRYRGSVTDFTTVGHIASSLS